MATITGLTAARMLAIEAASVISGIITGDNLILTKFDGSTVNAGNVRGPQGPQGVPGSMTTTPAGGHLTGSYPNPTLLDSVVTDAKVAASNKDGTTAVPSMRTLGTGAQQAAAGTHSHGDTGWIAVSRQPGDAPFGGTFATRSEYRKVGRMVHVRIEKDSTAAADRSGSDGNFPNSQVMGAGTFPLAARPTVTPVNGPARMADSPATVVLAVDGGVTWTGGYPRNYLSGSLLQADFVFFTDN